MQLPLFSWKTVSVHHVHIDMYFQVITFGQDVVQLLISHHLAFKKNPHKFKSLLPMLYIVKLTQFFSYHVAQIRNAKWMFQQAEDAWSESSFHWMCILTRYELDISPCTSSRSDILWQLVLCHMKQLKLDGGLVASSSSLKCHGCCVLFFFKMSWDLFQANTTGPTPSNLDCRHYNQMTNKTFLPFKKCLLA